jgi:hypothetical protein
MVKLLEEEVNNTRKMAKREPITELQDFRSIVVTMTPIVPRWEST